MWQAWVAGVGRAARPESEERRLLVYRSVPQYNLLLAKNPRTTLTSCNKTHVHERLEIVAGI